jgi:hypothetical protein
VECREERFAVRLKMDGEAGVGESGVLPEGPVGDRPLCPLHRACDWLALYGRFSWDREASPLC